MCFTCSVLEPGGDADPGGVDEHVEAAVLPTCSATIASQSSSFETSTAAAWAPSSAAAASTFSRVREASVSAKPSSRSMQAIARPMPDEPPVTRADGMRRLSQTGEPGFQKRSSCKRNRCRTAN